MGLPKYRVFINTLLELLENVSNREIKEIIGDSVNNHRTVSVVQTIRFLNQIGEFKLANQLENTYDLLFDELKVARIERGVSRQDGFDIYELTDLYEDLVIDTNNVTLRRIITQAVA